jgi:splicing factor 3B subunit 2
MALSTAEKNRRKRERKKKEKEERRQEDDDRRNQNPEDKKEEDEIEIEYVVEPIRASESFATIPPPSNDPSLPEGLPPMNGEIEQPGQEVEDIGAVLRRFHQRSAVATVVTDDERKGNDEGAKASGQDSDDEGEDDDDRKPMSKRKLRELIRPNVAALKRRVKRPDLVEAHDITAADPDFLIHLKAIPGTVPVPRHWGRKRKYLQGKRGFEKPPFQVSLWMILFLSNLTADILTKKFFLVASRLYRENGHYGNSRYGGGG